MRILEGEKLCNVLQVIKTFYSTEPAHTVCRLIGLLNTYFTDFCLSDCAFYNRSGPVTCFDQWSVNKCFRDTDLKMYF